jgi:predicted alpha/beta superfamily hydrolase
MIIVAIPNTNRVRDLLPTHSTVGPDGKSYEYLQQSGGTDNFLKFITNELAPKIESTYRTFPYRILIGQSFGGIAVIHTLFTKPEAFNAYVAIDPSLWWDNEILTKQAHEYFNKADLKGRAFFLAQANSLRSWDTTSVAFETIKEFAALLETRNRSGVKWKYQYYPDDTHSSVAFIAEYDALRFIFERYSTNYKDISTASDLKKQYLRLTEETGVKFIPPERVTHDFGSIYRYLGKEDVAQEFFQMNIDNYPQSSSAYANMGQFWRSKGEKRKALEYYEKSLKIYPGNEDSRNNVESLKKELETRK